jgi:hypothetical protein
MADEKQEGEQQERSPAADVPEAPANVEMPIEQQQPADPVDAAKANLDALYKDVFNGVQELRLPIQGPEVMKDALAGVNTVIANLAETYGLSVFDLDLYKNALVLRERVARALTDRRTAEKIVDLQTIMARAMDAEDIVQKLAGVVEGLELKLGEGFSVEAEKNGYVPKANVPGLAAELGYVSPHEDSNRFSQAVKEAGYVPKGTVPEGYVEAVNVPLIAQNQHGMIPHSEYEQVNGRNAALNADKISLQRKYDLALARARKAEAALKGKGKKR